MDPRVITIRRATVDDGPAVGAVTERAYRGDRVVDDSYAAELADGGRRIREAVVFVAVDGAVDDGGAVLGCVTLAAPGTPWAEISRDDELEVRMLAVHPDARRRRIADQLMDASEAHALDVGLAGVVLSTAPHMTAAHRLYERRGYVPQPDRDWHIDDLHLLAYRLALPR